MASTELGTELQVAIPLSVSTSSTIPAHTHQHGATTIPTTPTRSTSISRRNSKSKFFLNQDNGEAAAEDSAHVTMGDAHSGGYIQYEDDYDRNVAAVFVARFDTQRGNMIEWQFPDDFDLTGVEFQAIPSGLHNVSHDVIFFSKSPNFGVSVYENAPITAETGQRERGARMRSVGVIVTPTPESGRCGQVWRHVEWLRKEVSERIKNPSADYTHLQTYFTSNHSLPPISPLPTPTHSATAHHPPKRKLSGPPPVIRPSPTLRASSSTATISSVRLHIPTAPPRYRNRAASLTNAPSSPSMFAYPSSLMFQPEVSTPLTPGGSSGIGSSHLMPPDPAHPAHRFPDFVKLFGPSVFVLWKAALLKKKIVFLVPAPVERGCYLVYNTCLLAALPRTLSASLTDSGNAKLQPLFCVGVNDMESMGQIEGGYVACTPDRIFAQKSGIYDLLVTIPSSYQTSPIPEEATITSRPPHKTNPSSILLSQLVSHPEFSSPQLPSAPIPTTTAPSGKPTRPPIVPTKFNTTDLRRYRILRRLLIDSSTAHSRPSTSRRSSSLSIAFTPPSDATLADDNTEDRDALADTMRKMLLGGWFWWYGRDNRSTRRWRGDPEFGGPMPGKWGTEDEDEERRLLLGADGAHPEEGEEDAQELRGDGSVLLVEAVREQGSTRVNYGSGVEGNGSARQSGEEVRREELDVELIRFFHLLSTTLLTTLRALLSSAAADADGADDFLFLYPEHLEQLGLDPSADARFVEELARVYFGKEVEVVRTRGVCGTCWEDAVERAVGWGCAAVGENGGCCCFEGLGV